MLSDTLSDAIHEIRRYQNEMPEQYADIREWVDAVVQEMEALRRYLDLPFMHKQIYAMRQLLRCPEDEQRQWLVQVLPEAGREDEVCRDWLADLKQRLDRGETV